MSTSEGMGLAMRGDIRDINSSKTTGAPDSGVPRRLAAIVAGDIAGYSRLMQLDEEGTHVRVKRLERELIEPTIREHHGRLIKTTGDGFIAIFDSPVEAVRCGIVIQQNMIGRNTTQAKAQWIEYRIGINLGDVIIETDDVFGDGVNVAARLEGLADPGEVFISGGIYEQIKHKIVCGYESLGDRKVKNITDPVRVYRVLPDPSAFKRRRTQRQSLTVVSFSLVVLALAGGVLWYLTMQTRSTGARTTSTPTHTDPRADSSRAAKSTVAKAPDATPPSAPVGEPAAQQQAKAPAAPIAPIVPPAAVAPAIAPAQVPQPAAPPLREPEMVPLPGSSFAMGSNEDASEKPVHQVTVKRFAIGKYPISIREWNLCAVAKACGFTATGPDDAPVGNASWSDAKRFAAWLAETTGKPYRLPTEAEWEYAARGGTQTRYWWGDQLQPDVASCKTCTQVASTDPPNKVGSFKPNPFGLHDMGGTVDQWVEDCFHKNYQGAPIDGSAWVEDGCTSHVLRSGSWRNDARYVRPSNRDGYDTHVRYPTHGFRIALTL
jgi:formylglycine-generating enzyme required for sulfatase activity/class 3 adenylate cyclase